MKNTQKYFILLLMLILLVPSNIWGQETKKEIIVKGVVEDDLGPIIGASVVAKNQAGVGVITNTEGKFSLKVGPYDVLVVTFVGYQPYELPVLKMNNPNNVTIKLLEDVGKIDEVVITASGLQQKKTLTGAITNVDVKQLNAVGSSSLSNSLAGVVPGIIAVDRSGEPGQDVSEFWIRGISTFGANQSALVLIDGIEGNLNDLDPSDIESFSILKDASATAVYGVRGANGVVLVTTRSGQEGRTKVTWKSSMTLSYSPRMPKYLEAYDYASLANEARVVSNMDPLYSPTELEIIKA